MVRSKTATGVRERFARPYLAGRLDLLVQGAFAKQTYDAGKPPFVTRASHIFRCRRMGPESSR
jgi:hypothetical protein